MTSKHDHIREAIKSWILEGRFTAHQQIDTENALVERFEVSRQTVRRAIGDLVNEGWLYRIQGKGTFCEAFPPSKNKQKSIMFLTTSICDYIFPAIIRGAESYLSSKGYSIQLACTYNDLDMEKNVLQNVLMNPPDGLIIHPTRSALSPGNLDLYFHLEKNNIPYVMINSFYPELQPVSVTIDDELGAYLAVEHLISLGHRKIAGLFKRDDLPGLRRLQGFVRAHRQYQIPIHPKTILYYESGERESAARTAMEQWMQESEKPTAVFCYNDELSFDIFELLPQYHLRVPQDISIVGFDDSKLSQILKLTTIKHPKTLMGEQAAKLICSLIEEENHSSTIESLIIQPEIIIRNSTSAI
jgi:GntR family transcriptional regulator, arabinose operon transcriptional repressor